MCQEKFRRRRSRREPKLAGGGDGKVMVMLPRVGRSCGGSRRRSSLPAGVITAALALFLAASPGLRLAAATSSSTSMEGSSGFDAEATDDDISDADSGDDSTSSLSTSFPATSVPIPTPESVTSTDAPAAAPTAVPAAAPTVAPTITVAGMAAPQGSLGAGVVKGTLSATGLSILLIDAVGEEGIIQAAVCALTPCPGGTTSVVVGEASLETRRSLRRRLDNLEAVAFAVPTEDAGVEAGEGGLTGAEYAATMINQIADPEGLSLAANVLGVSIEDVSFDNVRYFQGEEVPIAADLEFVLQQDAEDAQEPGDGIAVLAALVIGLLVLVAGCLMIVFGRRPNSTKKRSNVQDRGLGRMASFPPSDVGNADPAARPQASRPFSMGLRRTADPTARQQASRPFSMGLRRTAATSKAGATPPQAAEATKTSVDTEVDGMKKPSSPRAGIHGTSSNLYEVYGSEHEGGSGNFSDLAGLALVGGKTLETLEDNINPLYDRTPPRSPISSFTKQQRPYGPLLWAIGNAAGARRVTLPRVKGGATATATARNPVSTDTTTKPRWRSSWPPMSDRVQGKIGVPAAFSSSNGDDKTETSSSAFLSAATSNATEYSSCPPYHPSATGKNNALHQSPASGLEDVEEVPGERQRPSRVSHDDAIETKEGTGAHPATQSRPAGAAAATETRRARPPSAPVGGDGTGVGSSKRLSCVSPGGDAGAGEADADAGFETPEKVKTRTTASTEPKWQQVSPSGRWKRVAAAASSRADKTNATEARETTQEQPSESVEGATTACIDGLPGTAPRSGSSPSLDRAGTAVTSAAAAAAGSSSSSTNEPGSGDKSRAFRSDRTSTLMAMLVTAMEDKSRMGMPPGRRLGHSSSMGPAGENGGSIPSSPVEKKAPVTKKQVRFQLLPDLQMPASHDDESHEGGKRRMAMRDPDGGGLSQPRTASGADEQNGYGFSPCERPPHEQQHGAETAHGSYPHRRRNSGSTDSSLASLPNSPGFQKYSPSMAAQQEDGTDSCFSSALSIAFPRREPPGRFPRREFEETESQLSSAPVSPLSRVFAVEAAEKTRRKALFPEASAESPRRGPGVDTWEGVVEAAARRVSSDRKRMTRSSSMPDAAAHFGHGRKQGRANESSRNGRSQRRAPDRRRYSSAGGKRDVGGGIWGDVTVSAAEPTLGSAYDELFANRGESPKAVRPTQAKARPSTGAKGRRVSLTDVERA